MMKLAAHIFIHNFFITAICVQSPELKGLPVAVLSKNKVLDVSPEAGKAGVFVGLAKRHALQACPSITFIEYKSHAFKTIAADFAGTCSNISPRVELFSDNEAFVDLGGHKPPTVRMLQSIVNDLVPRLGSAITITLAPNRLLAKAAALLCLSPAHAKTSAIPGMNFRLYDKLHLYVVKNETSGNFAYRLPLETMWPLDKRFIKRFKALGLNSFGDISKVPLSMLYNQFGSIAPILMDYSQGRDQTTIPVFRPPDQVVYHSHCSGADRLQLEALLKEAAVYICQCLQERGQSYRQLTLSVFFEDSSTEIKTAAYSRSKFNLRSIYHDCLNLLRKIVMTGSVTELAVATGSLTANSHSQMSLFTDPKTLNSQAANHQEKLAGVCAALAAKYAPGVISMGKTIQVTRREQMLMFVDPLRNEA